VKCIDDEIPFEIPNNWCWSRLGTLCDYLHRGKSPKYGEYHDLPIIAQKCNQWDKIYVDRCLFVSRDTIEKYTIEQYLQLGDILINSTGGGTVGRTGIVEEYIFDSYKSFVADSHVTVVRTNDLLEKRYIYYFLVSPFIQTGIEERCSGSTNQIELGTSTIYQYLVPIPPFEEQKRIAIKIDKLLSPIGIFGKLQEKKNNLNEKTKLILRKSILQEAIQGKLVSQDTNDEPASVLLEKILTEKQRLVETGQLKPKDVVSSYIFKGDDNKYYEQINGENTPVDLEYEFPETWIITRLSTICRLIDGERKEGIHICLDAKYLRGKSSGETLTNGKFVQKGDNIILVDGENSGEVFTTPCDGYMGSTFKQLWTSSAMHLPYVLYFIQFYKELLRNSKRGAAIPHLNKEIFYSLVIGVPPYNEQVKIAERIDTLFDKIRP